MMADFEAEALRRYASLDGLRYTAIQGGIIPKADPSDISGDTLARSGYIDFWKAVLRYLTGTNCLLRNTANNHLQQLFGVEIQNRKKDTRVESW